MINVRSIGMAAVLLSSTVACSNGGGLFGLSLPDGNIVVTDALTGKVLTTSHDAPFPVPDLRFAIGISEGRFSGPYSISIIKQENIPTPANNGQPYPFSFNQPCFVAHFNTSSNTQANVVTFQGDNANGKLAAFPDAPNLTAAELSGGGNPCHSGELETAAISDGKGHIALFYYEELP